MAIKVMADSGGTVTYSAAEIGSAFNTFASGNDYIIEGIGGELELTYSSTSLNVSIASGRAMVCGRLVTIDSVESLAIGSGLTDGVYVVLRVDMSMPLGSEGFFTYVTQAQIKEEDINGSGVQHDLILGFIKSDTSGITSFNDQRIIQGATGGSKFRITKYDDETLLAEPLVFEIVVKKES